MQLNLLVLSYVVSTVVSGAVAIVAWHRREMVGARALALLMVAVGWWSVASAFEASSPGLTAKVAWSAVAYLGIESAPVLYLLFVLGWTRQDGWLSPPRVATLFVVPVVSVGMAATNDWHHLLWPTIRLIDAWGATAVYTHGPWFWIEAAYAYALTAVGLVALASAISRYPALYAAKIRLVIIASLVPLITSLVYAAGLDSALHADLSSIAFAVAGLIGAWAVLRSDLLDIVPAAWSTLVDSLADAVVVLDHDGRIAAFNSAAAGLFRIDGDAVGRGYEQALSAFPTVVAACRVPGELEVEVHPWLDQPVLSKLQSSVPAMPRWLNVRVSSVRDGRGRDAGRLVVLRDVTERRQMVETIRELSLTDELTGLLNRRGFTTLAEQQLPTSLRTRDRLWLVFADLDDLKAINDRLGHEAGDRALCELARLLKTEAFRQADIVARYGGDEFAILATEVSAADEDHIIERLRDAVARANETPGRDFALSVSAGVALFDPKQPRRLDELIGEADRLMYQAKHSGRAAMKQAG